MYLNRTICGRGFLAFVEAQMSAGVAHYLVGFPDLRKNLINDPTLTNKKPSPCAKFFPAALLECRYEPVQRSCCVGSYPDRVLYVR
jgi:hypothetical protein